MTSLVQTHQRPVPGAEPAASADMVLVLRPQHRHATHSGRKGRQHMRLDPSATPLSDGVQDVPDARSRSQAEFIMEVAECIAPVTGP